MRAAIGKPRVICDAAHFSGRETRCGYAALQRSSVDRPPFIVGPNVKDAW